MMQQQMKKTMVMAYDDDWDTSNDEPVDEDMATVCNQFLYGQLCKA